MKPRKTSTVLAALMLSIAGLAVCLPAGADTTDGDAPAETTGQKIDRVATKVKVKVVATADKVGRKMRKAANKTGEGAKKVTRKVGKKLGRSDEKAPDTPPSHE